ncbi:MAG: fused MFS/spermidine synthase [Nitrospinota bacterium]
MPEKRRFSFPHLALYTAFFLSGGVGLAYEVVWARQLSLLFGVSIYAVSAVLGAFWGGLGIGAEYFGRKLDKGFRPVRLYAFLEIGLGIYMLLFPLWLTIFEKIYIFLHPGTEGISFYVLTLRFILAVFILIIPAALMGGTLPALVRYFADYEEAAGHFTGKLYAVNTLGAMVGCIATGFWMVEHLGLTNTLRVGASINLVIGTFALFMAGRTVPASPNLREQADDKKSQNVKGEHKRDTTLLVLFGLSGFCALALEVLWTRALILVLNNSTYAFSLILAVFLLGIGAGSLVTSRYAGRSFIHGERYFAYFQIGIGLFALLSLAGLALNQSLIGWINTLIDNGSWLSGILPDNERMAAAILFSLLLVFPCTFLMGGGMPLIVEAIASKREKIGGDMGRIYAVNTFGCVIGSLAAGYALVPLIGIHKSIVAISWLAVIGGGYLVYARLPIDKVKISGFVLLIILPLTVYLFNKGDISYLLSVQKLDAGSLVEYYQEGPAATVLVSSQESDMAINREPIKRLWINGDPIAGSFREALQLERLQAHIPLLLHKNPRNALVICFGTGSTLGATAAHGLENTTGVDISPEVFNAGRMFSHGNLNVMDNKKVTLVEEDGRNFLLTTNRKFDFISSEPPPPSNAGIVSLYTSEYYRLNSKRLAKGGIVSQWIPLHHLSENDFKMLVASFIDVFPYANMWYTKWDAIMIGSNEEMVIDFNRMRDGMKNPDVAASLEGIGVTNAYQLISNYMMGRDQMEEFVKTVDPLHDDRPVVEFSAPRIAAKGVSIKGDNLAALLKYRSPPKVRFPSSEEEVNFQRYFDSQSIFLKGQVEYNANRRRSAAQYYDSSLLANNNNNDARYAYLKLNITAINAAVSGGQVYPGLEMLKATDNLDKYGWLTPQLNFLRGMLCAKDERFFEAEAAFKEALRLDKDYFLALVNLAGLYGFKLNRQEEARELLTRALRLKTNVNERKAIMNVLKTLGENSDGAFNRETNLKMEPTGAG